MCSDERQSVERRRARRQARGFSILEGLVAAGILAVALSAFAGNSMLLTRSAKHADSTAAATSLAVQQLEWLRALPSGAAQHLPGNYQSPNLVNADGTTVDDANHTPMFTRRWTVSANNTPSNGLKTITVKVSWPGALGNPVALQGYVSCANPTCP